MVHVERRHKKKAVHQCDPPGVMPTNRKAKLGSRQKKRLKQRLLGENDARTATTKQLHVDKPVRSHNLLSASETIDNSTEDFGDLADIEVSSVASGMSSRSSVEDVAINYKSETVGLCDFTYLDDRIKSFIMMLSNFKTRAPEGLTRSQCLKSLLDDICKRYSYSYFLARKLYDLFPKELTEFIEANEVDRPITLRTNTLKTRRRELAQALINRGANVDPLEPWSRVGLVVYSSQVPLGATPEYLAGHYILQGAGSMLPVMALAPRPGERVLDLCAAPGGKATYIAQLMKNTGTLFANEVNPSRARALVGNCHRMGIINTVICVEDGRNFPKIMSNFDRVLLDAPCSGTGVIAKDPAVKSNKTNEDIRRCTTLQKELILAAVDSCKAGGYIVYSTCSILVEENEAVVDYVLKRRRVNIVETKLFGDKGYQNFKGFHFHPTMGLTRRYYPHKHNVDGFFVAKLKKVG